MSKVFIAGSIESTKFSNGLICELIKIVDSNETVLVGDAKGVDSAIQRLLADDGYKNVYVYTSNVAPRNNIGGFPFVVASTAVSSARQNVGRDFFITKDRAMALHCGRGVMVWNGKSVGTHRNIIELLLLDKPVVLDVCGEVHLLASIDHMDNIIANLPKSVQAQHVNLVIQEKEFHGLE